MISFCQDLSISYEYHVYQNKTIKKIKRKRNDSNVSERIITKSSKIQVISKNPSQLISGTKKGIQLIQPNKKNASVLLKRHSRTTSNYIQSSLKKLKEQDLNQKRQEQYKEPTFQMLQVQSIQLPLINVQQKLVCIEPLGCSREGKQKKIYNFFNDGKIQKSIQMVKSKEEGHKSIMIEKVNSIQYSQISCADKITAKTDSVSKLNQSILTKKSQYRKQESNFIKHHNRTSSFNSNQNRMETYKDSLFSNNEDSLFNKNYLFSKKDQLSSKQTNLFTKLIGNQNVLSFNSKEKYPLQSQRQFLSPNSYKFHYFNNPQQIQDKHNLQQKQLFTQFPIKNNYVSAFSKNFKTQIQEDKSILFDATSIISKHLKSDLADDQQSLSVVQQRNFFFEKQEQPEKIFKKSIEKFIFYQSGYLSTNKIWILHRSVQQKDNKKLYSIKQFLNNNQKYYQDQYQMYLALRIKKSQEICQQKNQTQYILQLFNALSNFSQKKLHLIKQTFSFILNDYLQNIKISNLKGLSGKQYLKDFKNKIQLQIKEIFKFLKKKSLGIKESQHLEIQDFVVEGDAIDSGIIKFHSLYKLEKQHEFRQVELNKQQVLANYKASINQSNKKYIHEVSNWCFYHNCEHNLRHYSQLSKQISQNIQETKLQDLFRKIEKTLGF